MWELTKGTRYHYAIYIIIYIGVYIQYFDESAKNINKLTIVAINIL